jgi:malonate transporter
LVSALPTGTGPFMLAQYYRADGALISRVVLITTLGSVITLSALVWWMTPH